MSHSVKTLINGQLEHAIDIADRGFQYGDGVFTTLAISQGVPLFLAEHLDRLNRDAARLGFSAPDASLLRSEVRWLLSSASRSVLKIVLTRGAGGRGYRAPQPAVPTRVLSLYPHPCYPPELSQDGVRARVCHLRVGVQPLLAGVKHLNRLEQVLARSEWADAEIHEGVLLDADDWVVEGVMSNLFMVKDERLITPLLDRCGVRGVMRELVMRLGSELNIPVSEKRITLDELFAADELFLTNSVIGIWPLRQLEQHVYGVGSLTRMLMNHLNTWTQREIARACGG